MEKTTFHKGWSGSTKHTATMGDGAQLGGRAPAERSFSAGPGAMANRVRPNASAPDRQKVGGKMSRYSEE